MITHWDLLFLGFLLIYWRLGDIRDNLVETNNWLRKVHAQWEIPKR